MIKNPSNEFKSVDDLTDELIDTNEYYNDSDYGFPYTEANCTYYAYDSALYLLQEGKIRFFNRSGWFGNANVWYDEYKYEKGSSPKIGSIACWSVSDGGNKYGHVAIVTAINDDGTINLVQGAYGGSRWYRTLNYDYNRSNFQGFLYLPDYDPPTPPVPPTYLTSGIDISNHKSDLTISSIASQVDFIILRASWTGYGEERNKYVDNSFERFYLECKQNNVPIGAYHYSCARTYDEGVEEAKFMYENCLSGKQMEYPVYLDVENSTWQTTSYRQGVTDAIRGFCDYMASVNWYGGVYANKYYFQNIIYLDQITDIDKWLAHYTDEQPSYMDYQMWQYSESISVSGYSGTLDGDYGYYDYPTFIKENYYNGYEKPIPTDEDEHKFPWYVVRRKKVAIANQVLNNYKK